MNIPLVPQYSFRDVTHISPEFLKNLGVRLLLLDLDNTVASYDEHLPSASVTHWATSIKNYGIKLFIVSNSVRCGRVEAFADALGIQFIKGASKPSPEGVLRSIVLAGSSVVDSALVGDQVFTDTLAANRAGVISIIVRPRRFTNPFLALRYALEAPFRAMCRNRETAGG